MRQVCSHLKPEVVVGGFSPFQKNWINMDWLIIPRWWKIKRKWKHQAKSTFPNKIDLRSKPKATKTYKNYKNQKNRWLETVGNLASISASAFAACSWATSTAWRVGFLLKQLSRAEFSPLVRLVGRVFFLLFTKTLCFCFSHLFSSSLFLSQKCSAWESRDRTGRENCRVPPAKRCFSRRRAAIWKQQRRFTSLQRLTSPGSSWFTA